MTTATKVEQAIRIEGLIGRAEEAACDNLLAEFSTHRLLDLYAFYEDRPYRDDSERDLRPAIRRVLRLRKVKVPS